ncbi:Serine/threonine-protein kinase ppk4 [Schistosoma japonicum]|nr:Serine/threonine-protein kinase ppk4 [Schistosoma japonicum]
MFLYRIFCRPILVLDPISGSLYEYASSVSEFLFQQLEHSIMGHVRRSPAYYKNFLSLGSKLDFWTSVDMNSGKVFESVFQDYVDKCPTSLNDENVDDFQNSTEQKVDIVNLGRTQYNLVLRDRFTGSVRLNITYNTFASHTEADLQNYDLQHVAITQPALLTFEGSKLIWSLPLSSPVIGMYALWSPSDSSSSDVHTTNENNSNNTCKHNMNSQIREPYFGHESDEKAGTFQNSKFTESKDNNNNHNKNSIKEAASLPRILRRIAFTTYALDLRDTANLSDNQIYSELEAKFSGTLDLAPSLYIGRSKSTPVYALMCLAEATLRIRGLRRASEMYMLEGPKQLIIMDKSRRTTTTKTTLATDTTAHSRSNDNWPVGLIGLYELPTSYKTSWDDDQPMSLLKRGKRLKRLSSLSSSLDSSTMWAVIVPPPNPLTYPTETTDSSDIPVSPSSGVVDISSNSSYSLNGHKKIASRKFLWFASLLLTALCIFPVFLYFLNTDVTHRLTLITNVKVLFKNCSVVCNAISKSCIPYIDIKNNDPLANSLVAKTDLLTDEISGVAGLLPSHFDTPDSTGWAGCSAQEAGQPEPIRFNLNKVLGHGANGTMVFAGTYGPHETAVKRIVRHPLLEKHWRREHAILLKHQHPHLVRCYWTGSTANFHYLVMQRCSLSLNEALSMCSSTVVHSDDANSSSNTNKASLFDDFGLTPVQIIHQFILAVACLHRNQIVHRDLKPSNILITLDNNNNIPSEMNYSSNCKARIVVGDFGLSRPLPADQHEQQQDAFNSIGPHISVKMQQIKSHTSYSPQLNNSSIAVNSPGDDAQSGLTSTTITKNNNVFGISVRYGDQEKYMHSNVVNSDAKDNSICFTFGTLGWMAPELCDAESASQVTCAIDIFACGLLAYYVLTYGKHPYDSCDEEVNNYQTEKNTQSTICSSISPFSSSSFMNGSTTTTTTTTAYDCSSTGNKLKSFKCTTLGRQHERQLAIAERRLPNLNILTKNPINVYESYLSRYLIQTMLSSNPDDRPTAEEISYYPLFWSPNKVIRFISELSDIMDIKDLSSQNITATNTTTTSVNVVSRDCTREQNDDKDSTNITNHQRIKQCFNKYHQQQMLSDLVYYSNWVFNEHWFTRLEPELVSNLLSTRGYQDTSLLYLLRAIRNKHNHIWSLPEHVRAIYGYTQEGMAIYWTMRFPALLPLIYGLCNKHFTGNIHFCEFLPPKSVCKVFVGAPTNCPWWPIWNSAANENEISEISTQENDSTKSCIPSSQDKKYLTKFDMNKWKRSNTVHPYSIKRFKQYDKPTDLLNKSSILSMGHDRDQETKSEIIPNEVDQNENGCNNIATIDASSIYSNNHRRRRPNQPKKIRPSKKRFTIQRHQDMIAEAGSESHSTYEQ